MATRTRTARRIRESLQVHLDRTQRGLADVRHADPVATLALGAVQRVVGMDQQLTQVVAGLAGDRYAETGGDRDSGSVLAGGGGRDRNADPLGASHDLLQRALRQQDAELLAA